MDVDDLKKLSDTIVEASECELLCLQHAAGDGCCLVNRNGCYWRGGASARESSFNNPGFAVTCAHRPGENSKLQPNFIDF